jgi:hypothetical protein
MAIMIDIRIQLCAKWSQLRKRDSMNKKYLLLLTAISALSLAARADIIPTLSSVTGSSPNFTWNYSANVTVDQTVNTGDFFTIYDFGSIAPGSNTQPTGWTFSQALVGPTAALTSPTDNPNILNLTWTYSGTTPIVGSAALGLFSVITATDQLKTGQFTAEATRNSGPESGTKISNIGNVSVPVPEPSVLFPIMSLCAAIGVDRFLRRRKTA